MAKKRAKRTSLRQSGDSKQPGSRRKRAKRAKASTASKRTRRSPKASPPKSPPPEETGAPGAAEVNALSASDLARIKALEHEQAEEDPREAGGIDAALAELSGFGDDEQQGGPSSSSGPQSELHDKAASLVALCEAALLIVVHVQATNLHINLDDLTDEDNEKLVRFSDRERAVLTQLAPFAVPYLEYLLEKLPLLGAFGFGFAFVRMTADRYAELKKYDKATIDAQAIQREAPE